jgi:FlaA1/EpsC-like NDP-sugar epimerase
MTDIAKILIANRKIKMVITGIRPGEKVHEILVSEEEANRTIDKGKYYVILPMLPELNSPEAGNNPIGHEFSSADNLMSHHEVKDQLARFNLLVEQNFLAHEELLR